MKDRFSIFFLGVHVGLFTCLAIVVLVAGWPPSSDFRLGWVPKDSVTLETGPFEIPAGGEVRFVIEPDENGELHARQVIPEPSPEPEERGT